MSAGDDPSQWARRYASRAWPVFPVHSIDARGGCTCGRADCRAPGKHPRTRHGHRDATTDLDTVQDWWSRWPDANIGLLTGSASGLLVLDIDPRHGGDYALHDLEAAHGQLPVTVQARTGGGGRHIVFEHVAGLSNARGALPEGIDVRGEGGYIVVEPSVHVWGGRYAWEADHGPGEIALQPPPEWLVALLKASRNGNGDAPPVLEHIPDGRRNDTLTRIAGHLRRPGLDEHELAHLLHEVNRRRCRPPLDRAEVDRIARSIATKPAGDPVWTYSADGQEGKATTSRLLSRRALAELPPPTWLLDRLVEAGAFNVIFGPPGSAKSFLALDWGLCISQAVAWYGRRPDRTGPVAYIAAEGAGGLDRRVTAWETARGVLVTDGLHVLPEAVNFMRADEVDRFAAELDTLELPPALVLVDTMARCMAGGDENSARDVGAFIAQVDRLRRRYNAAALVVHHTRKDGEVERGSGALRGAADVMWVLGIDGEVRRLRSEKTKDHEAPKPWRLVLKPMAESAVLALPRGVGVLSHNEAAILQALSLGFGSDPAPAGKLRVASGVSASSFFRAVKSLVAQGFLDHRREATGSLYALTGLGAQAAASIDSHEHSQPRPTTPKQAPPYRGAGSGSESGRADGGRP